MVYLNGAIKEISDFDKPLTDIKKMETIQFQTMKPHIWKMENIILTVCNPKIEEESAEIYNTIDAHLVAFMFRIYVKSSHETSVINTIFFVAVSGDTYACSFSTTKQRIEYL